MRDKKEYYLILALLSAMTIGFVLMSKIGDITLMFMYPFFFIVPFGIVWMIKYWHLQERDIRYIPKEIALKFFVLFILLAIFLFFNLYSFLSLGLLVSYFMILAFNIFSILYDFLIYAKLKEKQK